MAANERNQGEDRRIFLTPQMLQVGGVAVWCCDCRAGAGLAPTGSLLVAPMQVLLRARGLGALAGSDSEGEEEDEDGSGDEGGRHVRTECSIM